MSEQLILPARGSRMRSGAIASDERLREEQVTS
jgi:hypothetical protein